MPDFSEILRLFEEALKDYTTYEGGGPINIGPARIDLTKENLGIAEITATIKKVAAA